MKTLVDLFNEIGRTDKHTLHSYGLIYDCLFKSKQETLNNFLEVGVSHYGGGDLESFGHYFPNGQVYGMDNVSLDISNFPKNVNFILGDAYDKSVLSEKLPDVAWDIVLDDGPHTLESQIFFLNYFKDKMAKDGLVVVEDIPPHHVGPILTSFEGNREYLTVLDRRISRPNNPNRDDIIIIYQAV